MNNCSPSLYVMHHNCTKFILKLLKSRFKSYVTKIMLWARGVCTHLYFQYSGNQSRRITVSRSSGNFRTARTTLTDPISTQQRTQKQLTNSWNLANFVIHKFLSIKPFVKCICQKGLPLFSETS